MRPDDHDEHGHGHDAGSAGHHDHRASRGSALDRLLSPFRAHSHDAKDSIDSALESSAKGIRAVRLSLVALLATALFQVALVAITGSVALLADTIHNFSDALTSVPLWIAFVLGRRAATRSHTFGYRRAEDLAGLFIVAMIALSAIVAGWESIRRLIEPQPITNLWLVVVAGVIGFAGNEIVALYRIRVGREIGSAALIADGYHARTDGLTSLAVVLGAAGVAIGIPRADPLVGLLITGAILLVLKDATGQVVGRLMDAVDPRIVEMVERAARRVPEVQDVGQIRVRWVGHRLETDLHLTVDCDLSVASGHRVGEAVRHALFHEIRGLDEALVHIDPCGHDEGRHHEETEHHMPGAKRSA